MRFWLLRRSCLTPPPPLWQLASRALAGEVFDLSTVYLTTVDPVRWFQRLSQKWSRDFSNAVARAFVAGAPPEWLGPGRFELHRAELTSCPGRTQDVCCT